MPKPLHDLREQLLHAGVAPRHVRRYLAELTDHLADLRAEENRPGRSAADAESAALARLGSMDDLARAMIAQRQFQSWCARAPWAMFSLAPALVLATAWFVALFILWSGWTIFLPGAVTPFGTGHFRLFDLANIYFQIGRSIYLGAPILVGWGIALVAVRQRIKALWPFVGLVLIALLGSTGQVHAHPPMAPGELAHVSMGFTFAPIMQGNPFGLLHALILLTMTAVPYLVWRLQQAYSRAA
ncbi:MAG TPA: hypothetical protein VMV98_02055 [Acidobacteriaceae bacterium]|nr:hypothetical protein [Acidobacteriaceae bacterium]